MFRDFLIEYLIPLFSAANDKLDSIVGLVRDIALDDDSRAGGMFAKYLEAVFKSSEDQSIALKGALIDLAINSYFLVRDEEYKWEYVFLAAHMQRLSVIYWEAVRDDLVVKSIKDGDLYYIYDDIDASVLEIISEVLDAATVLYYDAIISLVDKDWQEVVIGVSSSIIMGVTTGTALTPLPYFGSSVSVGQLLGKSASCSVLFENYSSCIEAQSERASILMMHAKRLEAMEFW